MQFRTSLNKMFIFRRKRRGASDFNVRSSFCNAPQFPVAQQGALCLAIFDNLRLDNNVAIVLFFYFNATRMLLRFERITTSYNLFIFVYRTFCKKKKRKNMYFYSNCGLK